MSFLFRAIEEVPVKMSPIYYHNALSPPSRMGLLTIRNLGLEVEVKVIDTYKGEQHKPEYLKINPLHQVPVYVDEDFILTESRAIACFLASSAKSKLYPTDLKKRALVDARLYFDATNSFPVIRDFAVSQRGASSSFPILISFLASGASSWGQENLSRSSGGCQSLAECSGGFPREIRMVRWRWAYNRWLRLFGKRCDRKGLNCFLSES